MIPEVYQRSVENRQAQRVLRQRAFYVSAMTALKNRVHAFLAQQREDVRGEVARETNIFSAKGQKVLLGLELGRGEKKLMEALLKTYRHLETRIEESTALVEKLYEESREAQLIRTIPGFGKYLAVLAAVEAVWPAIRADFDLRCFFERLARGKGANKAKVATARRLLTIIYKVLKEGRNYIAYRR